MGQSEKQKEWKQNEFQSNKEIHNLRQRQRRQDIRDLVEKLKKPCLVCGETEKACIDFHHVNKDDKEFTIAAVCNHKWSDDKIINEIEKCLDWVEDKNIVMNLEWLGAGNTSELVINGIKEFFS